MRGMAALGLHGLFGGLPGVLLAVLLGPGAGSASAEPWRVGRHVDDCDPPCHFHDLTLETPDPGGGVRYAMESPSVLSGDSVEVWPGVYLAPFAMESDVILFSREGVDSVGASGNRNADPLLCDPLTGVAGVCLDSPALGGDCGVTGFTPPGGNCTECGPVSAGSGIETRSWGLVKADYRVGRR
jgi:hypothetical protein